MDPGFIDVAFIKADEGQAAVCFGKSMVDMTSPFKTCAGLRYILIEQVYPRRYHPGAGMLVQ